MIWCPHCHYTLVLSRFPDDRCPQCRKVVGLEEALHDNPYKPEVGNKMGIKRHKAKQFEFDQKDGSNTEGSGSLASKPVDPVFGISGRI